MRAFAILLLLATASAVALATSCPESMRKATAADRKLLERVGHEAFAMNINAFCDKMPVYVTQPSYFDAGINPICTNRRRDAATFRVTFKNPCNASSLDTVTMTVDTKPDQCKKTYEPRLAKWGWYTKTPGNMRPLECPAGFRTAGHKDLPLLTAFIRKQFLEVSMPKLEKKGDRFFCKGGIAEMRFHYQNGCIQTWPKDVSPYVMSQGKVDYTCYDSSKTLKLGLDGEGTYKRVCEWDVAFEN